MNIWQDSNNAVNNSIPNSSTASEDKWVSYTDEFGITMHVKQSTLDTIFGTPEEITKQPKDTLSFRVIDFGDESK